MTRTALVTLVVLAAACSTRALDDGGPGADLGVPDAAAPLDAASIDGAATDGGGTDSGPGVDASADASARSSSPPAGYTPCGAGTFTGADAVTACETAPTIGALPYPSACGGATSTGGRWEIWCPPPGGSSYIYFWAELDGVTMPGATCLVMVDGGTLPLTIYGELGGARYEGRSGAGGSSGDVASTPGVFLGPSPTTDVVEGQLSVGGTLGATGTLHLWVPLILDSCPGTTGGGSLRYVLGIDASWGGADS